MILSLSIYQIHLFCVLFQGYQHTQVFATDPLPVMIANDDVETDSSSVAEYDRIGAEMEKLAKRQIWEGVEKQFVKIEGLGVEIQYDHYLLGAQSSQELGNIYVALQRLRKARTIKKRKQIQDWIDNIEREYGLVHIEISSRRKRKNAQILPLEPPLDPVKIGAIKYAQEQISTDGIFYGMLPLGKYELVGQNFELSTGLTINLKISPFLRSKGIKEPSIIQSDDLNE